MLSEVELKEKQKQNIKIFISQISKMNNFVPSGNKEKIYSRQCWAYINQMRCFPGFFTSLPGIKVAYSYYKKPEDCAGVTNRIIKERSVKPKVKSLKRG